MLLSPAQNTTYIRTENMNAVLDQGGMRNQAIVRCQVPVLLFNTLCDAARSAKETIGLPVSIIKIGFGFFGIADSASARANAKQQALKVVETLIHILKFATVTITLPITLTLFPRLATYIGGLGYRPAVVEATTEPTVPIKLSTIPVQDAPQVVIEVEEEKPRQPSTQVVSLETNIVAETQNPPLPDAAAATIAQLQKELADTKAQANANIVHIQNGLANIKTLIKQSEEVDSARRKISSVIESSNKISTQLALLQKDYEYRLKHWQLSIDISNFHLKASKYLLAAASPLMACTVYSWLHPSASIANYDHVIALASCLIAGLAGGITLSSYGTDQAIDKLRTSPQEPKSSNTMLSLGTP